MDTPVPMPNTEVKHRSGDDSRKRQKQHAASLSGPQGDSFFFCLFTADKNKQIDFTTTVNRALIITRCVKKRTRN